MKLDDAQLIELLAQRYVLGTQRGGARRRFARLIDARPDIRRAVDYWEERLAPLAWSLEPIRPSDLAWQRICRELGIGGSGGHSKPRTRSGFWPALAAAFALIAVVTAAGWWRAARQPPEVVTRTVVERVPEAVAVALVADAENQPLWLTRIAPDSAALTVRALGDIAVPAEKDYELWAVTDAGIPVSLGLLPRTGSRTLTLGAAALDAIERSSTLAVSLEPEGGSPEAVPTGPVLYTAALLAP
ncbi:MAG TPA: anti-sigma factor [Woeseiaceae bacterium]|jgi:anti-sigma-K factor RskA|nr:anti-sigma factor [Woeseiaceae bacterium]